MLIFALLFAAVAGYLIWKSFAATGLVLTESNWNQTTSVNTQFIQESNPDKRNQYVVVLSPSNTAKAVFNTSTAKLDPGIYQACLNSFVPAGPASTIAATSAAGSISWGSASTKYSKGASSGYAQDKCLTNVSINSQTNNVTVTVTNTGSSAIHIGSVIITKTGNVTSGGTSSNCDPSLMPSGYTKVAFCDDFTGSSLNTNLWQPNWLGGSNTAITPPINGAEKSCYDPANVSVTGGNLQLSDQLRSCKASNGTTYSYASGLVESYGHFTFTNGYIEARVWLAGDSNGAIYNWPAVWTDGTGTWPNTGENDIMEGLSGKACFHYHSPSGGPGGCASGTFTGWHTFAAQVKNGVSTYFYDGNNVGSEATVNAPHYIILNLGVGGYGGAISAPNQMLVDYVRVWE